MTLMALMVENAIGAVVLSILNKCLFDNISFNTFLSYDMQREICQEPFFLHPRPCLNDTKTLRHTTFLILRLVQLQRKENRPKEEHHIQKQHPQYRWTECNIHRRGRYPQFPIGQHCIHIIVIQLTLDVGN